MYFPFTVGEGEVIWGEWVGGGGVGRGYGRGGRGVRGGGGGGGGGGVGGRTTATWIRY